MTYNKSLDSYFKTDGTSNDQFGLFSKRKTQFDEQKTIEINKNKSGFIHPLLQIESEKIKKIELFEEKKKILKLARFGKWNEVQKLVSDLDIDKSILYDNSSILDLFYSLYSLSMDDGEYLHALNFLNILIQHDINFQNELEKKRKIVYKQIDICSNLESVNNRSDYSSELETISSFIESSLNGKDFKLFFDNKNDSNNFYHKTYLINQTRKVFDMIYDARKSIDIDILTHSSRLSVFFIRFILNKLTKYKII